MLTRCPAKLVDAGQGLEEKKKPRLMNSLGNHLGCSLFLRAMRTGLVALRELILAAAWLNHQKNDEGHVKKRAQQNG